MAIKNRKSHNRMAILRDFDGAILDTPTNIQAEAYRFYKGLLGTRALSLKGIDLPLVRRGSYLSKNEARSRI